jgi:capsid protein
MTATARKSRILDASGDPFVISATSRGRRYESMPQWMARSFEAGETNRLNEAHWELETGKTINEWLEERLHKVRRRTIYECRNNPTLAGMVTTLCDDVVGRDGPELQVQSDSEAFNQALESAWREWFSAPTFRPNMSGAALLKLWVKNLPRCGEFLARIATDRNADGPVKMRLRPTHVRRLVSPADRANPRIVLGVEFDDDERVIRYWITETRADGYTETTDPWPPELVIHEFMVDEEGQARGFPWLVSALSSAADLRDFDVETLAGARLAAHQTALLFTRDPSEPWLSPESTTYELGTVKTVPPGWEVAHSPATQPPAQYPDYREERQRDLGRPMGMPLMMVRLDSSNHNYSSARFDGQGYGRIVGGIQSWLSGSSQSYGTLNRLVDLVAAEARFSSSALRQRPADVRYVWTWPARPHVDPLKERTAVKVGLETQQITLVDALALEGTTLEAHIAKLQRVAKAFEAAGLPLPAYMMGTATEDGDRLDPEKDDATEDAKAASNG